MKKIKRILAVAMAVVLTAAFTPVLQVSAVEGGEVTAAVTMVSGNSFNKKVPAGITKISVHPASESIPEGAILDFTKDTQGAEKILGKKTENTLDIYCKSPIALDTDCSGMFENMSSLTGIEGFDSLTASAVTDTESMFEGCSKLTSIDITKLDTSKTEYMGSMFAGCSELKNIDFSKTDTSAVKDMSGMFAGCTSLNTLDLESFNTGKVMNMKDMFAGCSSIVTILVSEDFTTDSVLSGKDMFKECSSIKGSCGTAYDDTKTDKSYAVIDRGTVKPGYFTAYICSVTDEKGTKEYFSVSAAVSALGSAKGEIKLLCTASEKITVNEGADITIDMNGKDIDLLKTYNVVNKGTLTVKDTSASKGFIRNGSAGSEGYGGAVLNDGEKAKLVLNGCGIADSGASLNGGAIANLKGTVDISNSASISGCSAKLGGAIYSTGGLNISGAVISKCTASENAGAIFNDGAGLSGGKGNDTSCIVTDITLTEANAEGHSPYNESVYNRYSTFKMSGGKLEGNIFCDDGQTAVEGETYSMPCKMSITGGLFTYKDLKSDTGSYIPEGYICVENDDEATKAAFPWKVRATKACIVAFDVQGTGTNPESQNLSEGSKVEKPEDPSDPAGIYNFDGWYTDTGYTDEWDFENDTVSGSMILYAKWSQKVSVADCKITAASREFNNKNQSTSIAVKDTDGTKLVKGTDYTLSGTVKAKKVGTYTATVKGIGCYTGSRKVSWKINPAAKAIKSVGAGSKKMTVKWTKSSAAYLSQTTGYQLMYSTAKSFKSYKTAVVGKSATSKTVYSLKSKKKYYVKMRAYTKLSGKTYVSAWSGVKTVTVK